jgi:hypothetical protein
MNSLVRPRNSGLVHIDAKILSGDTRSGSFNRFIHVCHSISQPEFSTFFPGLSMAGASSAKQGRSNNHGRLKQASKPQNKLVKA